MVAGALLTNGLPLWNGDILFFNVPEVIPLRGDLRRAGRPGQRRGDHPLRRGAVYLHLRHDVRRPRLRRCCLTTGAPTRISTAWKRWATPVFATLGSGTLLGVYLPIWLMIGFLVLGYWLTTKTPLGRYIYAIGGNESAARLAGVPIVKAKIFVYAFSGLCAAFVGLIVASQLQTAHPMTGNMFEMDAIGATVLGGTARWPAAAARVTGSIIGAFVIVFLADGMVMMGVSDFWQMVIKGVVIVTAVVVRPVPAEAAEQGHPDAPPRGKLAAIPQRRHLQLTGNDSHLPPGLVPGSAKGKKYATRFPEQNGGDHRRLPRHRRRHCRALCPRRRKPGDGLQRRARSRDRRNAASALSGGYFIAAGRCDRRSAGAVAVEQAAARFGTIDVSIQNAGVITIDYYDRMPKADFEKVLAVNTTGVWLCCREAAKYMVKQNHGSLINTSSGQGRQGFIYTPHYAASKMGVIGITQSLAHELAPWNITVNAFCPGIIESEMWDYNDRVWGEILSTEQKRYGKGELMAEWVEGIPMKRAGKPEDVAGLVAFLASDDARYLTGQTINIDGGLIMS